MNALTVYLKNEITQTVAKGTVIVFQDEIPASGFALKKGIVKLCNVTAGGTEKTLSFITPNGLFPLCWLFSKTERPLFYYQAHTECEVVLVNKTQFMHDLQNSAPLAHFLLNQYVEGCIADTLQLNALTQTSAASKLTAMFRQLCLRYGKDVRTNHVRISVPLTQQEIANIIGLARETTVIELSKLKRNKTIGVAKKYYTVDTDLLNKIIDDEYSPGIVLAFA